MARDGQGYPRRRRDMMMMMKFCVNTASMSKTVLFQTIQSSASILFKCKYSLTVKTFLFQAVQFSQRSNSNNSV